MTERSNAATLTRKSQPSGAKPPVSDVGGSAGAGAARSRAGKRGTATLAEEAYLLIKQRIVTLHYKPGALLNERNISADLGIGRMPVHMAISRIALEDLVDVVPRRGLSVKPLVLEDIKAVFEARLINEPAAAAMAATRATDQDLLALREIVKMSRASKRSDRDELLRIDRAFHNAVATAAHNRVLMQLLNTLHDRSLRQWFISWNYPSGRGGNSADDHKAIVAAIRRRDAPEASRLMREHLEGASEGFQMLFGQLDGFVRA